MHECKEIYIFVCTFSLSLRQRGKDGKREGGREGREGERERERDRERLTWLGFSSPPEASLLWGRGHVVLRGGLRGGIGTSLHYSFRRKNI